ncbi:OPA3-like protein [Argentina anserina]|uniref:OPA3-like protein n=1 Tax=Argentina anserina TaxID=57926 RepID=UPI00217693A0|nr:OPA3-like protein [Potentilla anserina]
MALPLVKLGTLLVKTISKPVAARLKHEAGKHPRFREIIVSMAQANHRITTKMQRRLYSHATDVEIRPLNEEKAVQAAVDLIGEFFVFTVAVVALIFEVQRSARSEARKEEARKQELEAMKQRDEELSREVELLRSKYEELEKLAKGQGLSGIFNFKRVADAQGGNSVKPARSS